MLLGFNMLLWASQITDEHFPLLAKIKQAGYDGVELPLFGGSRRTTVSGASSRIWASALTAVCVIPDKEHDCTSCDPRSRDPGSPISNGRSTVSRRPAARCCAARSISRSASSPATRRPTRNGRHRRGPQGRRPIRDRRPRSRSPSSRSTASNATRSTPSADAAEIVNRVDEPNYGLLYDTFHANIEEKDPVGVIAPAPRADQSRPHLGKRPRHAGQRARALGRHVQGAKGRRLRRLVCHRGLRSGSAGIAEATRVWRDFFPHTEEVYQFGHDFLRAQWARA